MTHRVFIDMDGVLADFDGMKAKLGITGDELVDLHGAFLILEPIPGAIDAVDTIFSLGFDVWIASRPAPQWPTTYADKAAWVHMHLPQLSKKLILTQEKGFLGDRDDVLIDDRPEKANCVAFPGHLIHFGHTGESPIRSDRWYGARDWPHTLKVLGWLSGLHLTD